MITVTSLLLRDSKMNARPHNWLRWFSGWRTAQFPESRSPCFFRGVIPSWQKKRAEKPYESSNEDDTESLSHAVTSSTWQCAGIHRVFQHVNVPLSQPTAWPLAKAKVRNKLHRVHSTVGVLNRTRFPAFCPYSHSCPQPDVLSPNGEPGSFRHQRYKSKCDHICALTVYHQALHSTWCSFMQPIIYLLLWDPQACKNSLPVRTVPLHRVPQRMSQWHLAQNQYSRSDNDISDSLPLTSFPYPFPKTWKARDDVTHRGT